MNDRRLVGIDLGIASADIVQVLDGEGNTMAKRKAWPTVESLSEIETAALVGCSHDARLEVIVEPTGPAWLPIAVFFTAGAMSCIGCPRPRRPICDGSCRGTPRPTASKLTPWPDCRCSTRTVCSRSSCPVPPAPRWTAGCGSQTDSPRPERCTSVGSRTGEYVRPRTYFGVGFRWRSARAQRCALVERGQRRLEPAVRRAERPRADHRAAPRPRRAVSARLVERSMTARRCARGALGRRPAPRAAPQHPPTSQQIHVESPHLHRHWGRSHRGQALVLAGGLGSWYTVNYMVQYARTQLDASRRRLRTPRDAVSSSSSAVGKPRSRTWPNGSA